MATTNSDSEIKTILKIVLKNEKLKEISFKVHGSSEKGDGYMGDVIFVSVEGTTGNNVKKTYDLVLKCSKKSETLRETSPVKEAFFLEIFMYQEVLPYLIQFQKDKGVQNIFDNVPKCYGCFTTEDTEVIALENLKCSGYELWPKKQPLSRKHIDLVVMQYSRYHATSLALLYQRPKEFQNFHDAMGGVLNKFVNAKNMRTFFEPAIDESSGLLSGDLDEDTLCKWKAFKDQINFLFENPLEDLPGVKVILHGDCWNNNFMYLHEKGEDKIPSKVKFLDWQISKISSPVLDLSYFLFTCLSQEDFPHLDSILNMYHKYFIEHLGQLGTEAPDELYPREQFLNDWRCYARYGILSASLLMKIVSTDRDEVTDITDVVKSGRDFTQTFQNDIRDKENYKRRIRPIVEYAVKNDLI